MKTIFIVIFLYLSTCLAFSQSSFFSISKLGSNYTESQLLESITKADWCGYYHITDRYQIMFDDGAIVELFSKKELGELTLNNACFQNENNKDNGIYKIHESGILIRMLSARNTSKN